MFDIVCGESYEKKDSISIRNSLYRDYNYCSHGGKYAASTKRDKSGSSAGAFIT